MERLVTVVMVLLVGTAGLAVAQSDDQQRRKRKQTQTTQATPTPTPTRTQTSRRHVSTQTTSNQQATKRHSNKQHSNASNSSGQTFNTAKKSKRERNVVANNNGQVNQNASRRFNRSGNEVTYNVAQSRFVRERHDRNWWRSRYSRIVFYGGGYWYWNAGWWYPAWGYSPYYNNYIYNGPIFGYGYAFPGDVTAQVQRALAARGYYYGPIDGILGPATRGAIQRYQIERGLAVTAAIDEPTLATLGLA